MTISSLESKFGRERNDVTKFVMRAEVLLSPLQQVAIRMIFYRHIMDVLTPKIGSLSEVLVEVGVACKFDIQ